MRLSKLSDYAIAVLLQLNLNKEVHFSAASIAQATALPLPTVAKVLKILVCSKLVNSIRGAGGGYFLAVEVKQISLKNVIEAVEGPLELSKCVGDDCECCDQNGCCQIKDSWSPVNETIKNTFESIKIIDMIEN